MSDEFKNRSGVNHPMFGVFQMIGPFHDAGFKGMYGGLGRDAIKRKKGILEKENLMDRMDTTELAANQFRMTQTRDKLARDGVKTEQWVIQTHKQVGKEVRAAIQRIGGTPPEQIPPAEPIKDVEKRLKRTKPRLVLDGPDAKGLLGKAMDGDAEVSSTDATSED